MVSGLIGGWETHLSRERGLTGLIFYLLLLGGLLPRRLPDERFVVEGPLGGRGRVLLPGLVFFAIGSLLFAECGDSSLTAKCSHL